MYCAMRSSRGFLFGPLERCSRHGAIMITHSCKSACELMCVMCVMMCAEVLAPSHCASLCLFRSLSPTKCFAFDFNGTHSADCACCRSVGRSVGWTARRRRDMAKSSRPPPAVSTITIKWYTPMGKRSIHFPHFPVRPHLSSRSLNS